ncbi:alpha/beta hydrolase [Rubrivivax gelatinosus]|uniref:alpha/beta hydrolase n=1 Tax=Rubrivivax gelatinosus TaxID=28068 RepID=UPI0002E29777|nr:alpha/beta hydrolase fold domain-containing protein [Rubrivivax gelatinosus]MBG6081770.1 acetyl esterase/lipase [Rubrivivax gelatinosus]
MAKMILQGRWPHRLRSLAVLADTTLGVLARRAVGRRADPHWSLDYEIGTLFVRRQFNHALALPDIVDGRAYFDSLYFVVEPRPRVDVRPAGPGEPPGRWYRPAGHDGPLTMLYLHGGGYAFDAGVSRHFVACLAQWLQIPIFAPDYRLTPEHAHPAQLDDGLAAYRHLLATGVAPRQLIVAGDSAGGHLALMVAARLHDAGLPPPALVIGLSPWTDIGRRGDSQFGHDRYDLVQGWQTLLYGRWLKGGTGFGDAELSPIHQRYEAAPPIYLQAGAQEILVDMIRDFARTQHARGVPVRLDVWPHANHEFHAYGDTLPQAQQALAALRAAIAWASAADRPPFAASAYTEVDGFR